SFALILAHPDLSYLFGDDVIQRREELEDTDLPWLLERLGERNDVFIRAIANLMLQRGLVPKVREVFVATIRDRSDLPAEVLISLVHAAGGNLVIDDIANFGRWYDTSVEQVLLAVCADVKEPNILLEGFDTLTSRSLNIEPSSSLVEWIRDNHWNARGDFARAVGLLANLDAVGDEGIEEILQVFDRYAKDSRVIDILLESNNLALTERVIAKYRKMIGVGRLINLLVSDSKEMRLSAIEALKNENDIGALRLIIDRYEKEKDPDVRQAYEKSFWMIRERSAGSGNRRGE
ncbi:MAG: hypothetical protein KDD53_11560, partial [Bdellovibrionales bacterium]|nr:hypothetical protein [Bdellovibrionales bacterium]